jgi:hypothetical protein
LTEQPSARSVIEDESVSQLSGDGAYLCGVLQGVEMPLADE